MNGWAKSLGGRWHQVEVDRWGIPCAACGTEIPAWATVQDYRWRPNPDMWCGRRECRREVEP